MSGVATPRRPLSSRIGGVAWPVFTVGMWIAFFVALLGDRLAVWESSLAPWLRIGLVVPFAIGWTLISIPRAKDQGGA